MHHPITAGRVNPASSRKLTRDLESFPLVSLFDDGELVSSLLVTQHSSLKREEEKKILANKRIPSSGPGWFGPGRKQRKKPNICPKFPLRVGPTSC
jgi:hypothetical protein